MRCGVTKAGLFCCLRVFCGWHLQAACARQSKAGAACLGTLTAQRPEPDACIEAKWATHDKAKTIKSADSNPTWQGGVHK
eukprot:321659-Amphidinium_carterae.2